MNQTLMKIKNLLEERNWSLYKLAKESQIPYSSLNSLFLKDNQPTISTLQKICDGFHITMAEFFMEDTPFHEDTYDITTEELEIIHNIRTLNKRDSRLLIDFMKLLEPKGRTV